MRNATAKSEKRILCMWCDSTALDYRYRPSSEAQSLPSAVRYRTHVTTTPSTGAAAHLPWLSSDGAALVLRRVYPRTATLLLDRDGPVIASHFPMGNGPLVAEAPAMAAMLRDLVSGIPGEELRARAELILRKIDRCAPREPGQDDE